MELLDVKNSAAVAEYEAFLQSHPKGHFAQSVEWARLKKEWDFEAVIERDAEGKIAGSMGLLIRKVPGTSIMYSCRGPVCDLYDEAMVQKLVKAAGEVGKKYKACSLKIDTDTPVEDEEFYQICRKLGFTAPNRSKNFEGIQPRFVFRLYLNGRNEEEMLASFHQKWRYNIRVAIKKGVEVKICGEEALPDFHRIMVTTGSRDGFVVRTEDYFRRMMRELGEHARLYMAYLDGVAIAGTLAIGYGDKVWYLYGASSNEHRNYMPNYLLQWEMIKWAIERGARVYDFRGVSGDLSEDNPLYGLYRFKKGFNGEFTEFVGEMDLIYNKLMLSWSKWGSKAYRKINGILFKLRHRG
ncbi:MAG: peptidoglycan bridge formation glycyltransferase FemA/FemB family protein [Clostridia bacterium]|nr:peptidoglycan bridge formation glycyltransferase FemA/FemB family protein [Clostridia bacterium]